MNNSYCLAVSAPTCQIIIPCVELIRFYFGSSGILLKRLFTRPFSEEHFWREKHYDAEKRHLHLKLADGMPKYAVSDLARIASCEQAREAAASIYANCLKASAAREPVYPHMHFPFRGKTSLQATGMWLPFDGKPKQTFLVFRLKVCSHPFAFDSLTYDPCERAFWRNNESDPLGNDAQQGRRRKQTDRQSVLDDTDPGARKAPRHILFNDSVRFSDLKRKPIRMREIVALGAKEIYMQHGDGKLEKVAFGEPEGSGEARAIDAGIGEPPAQIAEQPQKLPRFVTTGIAVAKSQLPNGGFGIEAKPLVQFGETDPIFNLPLILDEDGVVNEVTLFTEADAHQRTRRACFVGLFNKDIHPNNLVVIEGSKEMGGPAISSVTETTMQAVLALLGVTELSVSC